MHVKTGASAQTVQAHARSIEVDQSASGFATQTPAANYGALLDQDTHFAGDVTIPQEGHSQSVAIRILRTLQTLQTGAIRPTERHSN